jgi:hypothetical protein
MAVLEAMEDLDVEIVASMTQQMATIVADLCGGFPARDDILRVPPRIRNMFFAWVQEQVMSPEAVTGGGAQAASSRKR